MDTNVLGISQFTIETVPVVSDYGTARAEPGHSSGLTDSQDDALELINLLIYFKFPHTYDGVIARTVA